MSTVILATDGSELAERAMGAALAVLGPDHRYVALAVVPPAFVPTASIGPMETHPTLVDPSLEAELDDEHRQDSAVELTRLDASLGIQTEHRVETGEPGVTICSVASELAADLIVVGSHGHGWIQRVLMGSVSTHVLHHAPCPVMVMRAEL